MKKHTPIGSFLNFVIFSTVALALAYLAWKSLVATIDYTAGAMGSDWGIPMGVAIQFTQNLAIFKFNQNKHDSEEARDKGMDPSGNVWAMYVCVFAFIASATLDSATNIGQWQKENPSASGLQWYFGCAMSIAVIFVEEVFIVAVGAAAQSLNRYLTAVNGKPVAVLQWVQDRSNDLSPQVGQKPKGGPPSGVLKSPPPKGPPQKGPPPKGLPPKPQPKKMDYTVGRYPTGGVPDPAKQKAILDAIRNGAAEFNPSKPLTRPSFMSDDDIEEDE